MRIFFQIARVHLYDNACSLSIEVIELSMENQMKREREKKIEREILASSNGNLPDRRSVLITWRVSEEGE